MKKKLLWIFISFLIAVILNFIYFTARSYLFNNRIHVEIIEAARSSLLRTFPDAKIKEIMVEPSKDYVNFICDKLYRTEILYEKKGKFKKIAFNIGAYKRKLIIPSELELLELDKEAEIIFQRGNAGSSAQNQGTKNQGNQGTQ